MKIIDQGKLKLNTSKSVAIDRFLELQGTITRAKDSYDANLALSCNRYGDILIRYAYSRYDSKYIGFQTQLNGEIITEKDGTYILYYTSINRKRLFLICGALTGALILCLLFILFWGIRIQVLMGVVACIIALITQVSSIQREKDNPYANSDIYVNALKKYIDAVDNWEK